MGDWGKGARDAPVEHDAPSAFLRRLLRDGQEGARPALSRRRAEAGRSRLSFRDLAQQVHGLAASLVATGVRTGQRVALVGDSDPDWVVAFLAVLEAGAVVVPLDPRLTPSELAPLLADAGPALIITSSGAAATVARAAHDAAVDVPSRRLDDPVPGAEVPVPDAGRAMSDPAVLVYTSGTTGSPKGVTVSWANLAYQVTSVVGLQRTPPTSVFVSILPLHHLYELVCGCLGPLYAGARVHYVESILPADIVAAMVDEGATDTVVVPLFLRALRRRLEAEAAKASGLTRVYLAVAPAAARLLPMPGRRLLLAPLHARLGRRLRTFFVGGAPLDVELARYFEERGFHVCQGYGLSEATPVVAGNSPDANRLGSVGRPLPGTEVRIAEQGEIVVRGPGVMGGYWKRPELSQESIRTGWLHTGDVGRLDADGYLHVTGRLKNLIVLPSGKNVQPEEVEEVIERSAMVGDVCVVGREGPAGEEVTAVVTPSEQAVADHPDPVGLEEALQAEVRRAVLSLATYKRPQHITVVAQELPKTSTRKVRRGAVDALLAEGR